jgi:hypothetical protein
VSRKSFRIIIEVDDMTTPEGQALVQAIQALPAAFSTAQATATQALQSQLAAANQALASEKQNHADDLAAATAAVQAATPQAPVAQ